MKKTIFLFLFFNSLSLFVSKAEATFTPTISILNKEYKLVGHSLLEYSFFKIDVYWISYYKSSKNNNSLLKFIYARDIEKDVSNQGWSESLKNNLKGKFSSYKKEIAWLHSKTPDFKENDILVLLKEGPMGFIIHNGVIKAKTNNKRILELFHLPWIGPKPIDEDLKSNLLGNKPR
ncbi:MAG: hypothetical protein CME68_08060 [Halobacteriovoraceae bacterium]|nr:hypothetical protein [Halobacteriovoraceae bacterium]